MSDGERVLSVNGVDLCVETFGSPDDPAILLVHGACASMLWWETELCERLAAQRRFVIRYDQRDTGRSTSWPAGRPGYTLTDLVQDAIGILDVLGIDRVHLVGRSMSGAIALIAGVDHPERIASLTFVSTTGCDDAGPPMSPEFLAYTAAAPDTDDTAAVVDHVVGLMRVYSGGAGLDDESATRALAEQDVRRTRDLAATFTNHFVMDVAGPVRGGFDRITAPSLVLHGELDPVYPLAHGEALCRAIPGASLMVLPGTGHELPSRTWDVVVPALVEHTRHRSIR